MNTKTPTHSSQRPARIGALAVAIAIAFPSLPVWAEVEIDQIPLSVAKPPPPNILFIMDDSGSMAWQHMPGAQANWVAAPPTGLPHPTILKNDIRLRASNVNTLWYNPSVTYTPWLQWDGTSFPEYDPAEENLPRDPAPGNPIASGSVSIRQTTWPTVDMDNNQTGTTVQDWRFRGFYLLREGGVETNNADYVRYEFRRNGSNWEMRQTTLNSSGANVNVTMLGSTLTWPGGVTRTIDEEIQNFANWFTYYRLRANMAKAAASRAFAPLGEEFRIGYRTIWNRNAQSFDIPVSNNGGLFTGDNKSEWFSKLFSTIASQGTPLRQSLDHAGQYFMDSSASGPYGPGTGTDQLSCRQNFTIMTTDGYWNANQADTGAARANVDNSNGVEIVGVGNPAPTYTYVPEAPYRDSWSNTLADVAMYYWVTDLRPDMKNDVAPTSSNPAFWQHMRTFGVSIGLQGTLDPQTDLPGLTNGTISWPQPVADRPTAIDDLWHAAVNSRGEFHVANDPDAFAKALTDSLARIKGEVGVASAGAASSTQLNSDTAAYFASYNPNFWSGQITARQFDPGTMRYAATEPILASNALPAWNARNIRFNNSGVLTPFTAANLSGAFSANGTLNTEIVEYLRGNQALEKSQANPAGKFRERDTPLPTFVHSQIVYVGEANANFYAGSTFEGAGSYPDFVETTKSRNPVLYVGGNGGMLHAFDAETLREVFAFVPAYSIAHGMGDLADPDYQHRYFVDGELTVADIYDTTRNAWRSILIGTMGRGGRGVFALDVTNPDAISFLWERSYQSHPAMGNNLGKPIVAQVAEGDWRVLMGNGPNSDGDNAALIMIGALDGNVTVVDTGASGNNGLTAVRAWDSSGIAEQQAGDGFADTAYAGDLRGNVWRFSNLQESTPTVHRVFTTSDSNGNRQPITAAPMVALEPQPGAAKRTWVFVGTGQYLNETDQANQQVQTWYGLIDEGNNTIGDRSANLEQRRITSQEDLSGRPVRMLETGSKIANGTYGWYIDLIVGSGNPEGERMLAPNFIANGMLLGTTFIPDASDPCQPSGRGFLWAINPFTGGRLNQLVFDVNSDGIRNDYVGGIPPSGMQISGGAGVATSNPAFAIGGSGTGSGIFLPDEFVQLFPEEFKGARRDSWREVLGD
ncbi:MAG: pilus assembly protein [Rhodocyclaceae bacterium]